jgi:4-hydroxy-3-methylbut-2-enyl diphosphate reductase
MEIIVAKDAGYCFGVRDAVNMAYEAAKIHGTVYMLGDIVHNEQVVRDLTGEGVSVVSSIDEIPNNATVLFRAHGTPEDVWKQVEERGIKIIDATCPLVREIHEEAQRISKDGRQLIIIGDHGHDEVVGIASQVPNPIIIASPEEAQGLRKMKKAAVVCQSTQMIENVQSIINILMTITFDLHFVNTICFPTKRNHEQIKQMAEESDVIIVIGSFTSANSKRLTQLGLERNPRSYQVTCGVDVKGEWFEGARKIGISAGASTPDYLIEEVKAQIHKVTSVAPAPSI